MAWTKLHEHGDGTYHTETHNGKIKQHEHGIGSALMHMAKLHGDDDAAHMHIEEPADGGGYRVHTVDGGGVTAHNPSNMKQLAGNLQRFFAEESQETK